MHEYILYSCLVDKQFYWNLQDYLTVDQFWPSRQVPFLATIKFFLCSYDLFHYMARNGTSRLNYCFFFCAGLSQRYTSWYMQTECTRLESNNKYTYTCIHVQCNWPESNMLLNCLNITCCSCLVLITKCFGS